MHFLDEYLSYVKKHQIITDTKQFFLFTWLPSSYR